jgi:hypothetical protein
MTSQTNLTFDERTLERGGWLVNRLDVNYGLQMLEVTATWDEDRKFQLIFKNFHLVSLEIFDDEYEPGTVNLDVIGFDLGKRGQRNAAVLHTDMLEMILTYSELEILKDW